MNANRVVEDRFWSKVAKSDDCWQWTGPTAKEGYGQFRLPDGTRTGAHRMAYELTRGPIPENRLVMHLCDNPACVNPDHLQVGTHAENMRDRNAKGRQASGVRHGRAKLTPESAKRIRALYARGRGTVRSLAQAHSVSPAAIYKVLKGKSWTE